MPLWDGTRFDFAFDVRSWLQSEHPEHIHETTARGERVTFDGGQVLSDGVGFSVILERLGWMVVAHPNVELRRHIGADGCMVPGGRRVACRTEYANELSHTTELWLPDGSVIIDHADNSLPFVVHRSVVDAEGVTSWPPRLVLGDFEVTGDKVLEHGIVVGHLTRGGNWQLEPGAPARLRHACTLAGITLDKGQRVPTVPRQGDTTNR